MDIEIISRLEGSGRADQGSPVSDEIQPDPVWTTILSTAAYQASGDDQRMVKGAMCSISTSHQPLLNDLVHPADILGSNITSMTSFFREHDMRCLGPDGRILCKAA